MTNDPNPLSIRMHLHDLDRQAQSLQLYRQAATEEPHRPSRPAANWKARVGELFRGALPLNYTSTR